MRRLLQRNQRGERVVGVELLLDAGEFDQLLGELVGVERIERILICSCVVSRVRKLWKLPAICCEASELAAAADALDEDETGSGVEPETIELAVFAVAAVMSFSSDPDVDAAA